MMVPMRFTVIGPACLFIDTGAEPVLTRGCRGPAAGGRGGTAGVSVDARNAGCHRFDEQQLVLLDRRQPFDGRDDRRVGRELQSGTCRASIGWRRHLQALPVVCRSRPRGEGCGLARARR